MKLIQKFVSKLGFYRAEKQGDELIFSCPKCHREKLGINIKKQFFHCFRCGYGGTLDRICEDLQIQRDRSHVVSDVKWHHPEPVIALEEEPVEFKIPKYKPFSVDNLMSIEISKFLFSRGITTFALNSISDPLPIGISEAPALKGRLIIPIRESGKIVSYVARSVDGREPKEISGPDKSHYLYNLDEVEEGATVHLVEGIFDCEALRKKGWKAVAVLGSHISDIQIGKLLAKKPCCIQIMFDGDEAGKLGAHIAYMKLIQRTQCTVTIYHLPEGKDPDELTLEELNNLDYT